MSDDTALAEDTTIRQDDTSRVEVAPPMETTTCVPGLTKCTNCIDDDGDGLIDGLDPECTGLVDDDESSFALGIPDDPCRPGCAFDGLVGDADPCTTDGVCVSGNTDPRCPYDEKAASSSTKCPRFTDACRDHCMKRMPENCDCFGCCWTKRGSDYLYFKLTATCRADTLSDESKCPRCVPSPCVRCPEPWAACSPTRPCTKYYCLTGCCVPVGP
jgi:hypothetical protein